VHGVRPRVVDIVDNMVTKCKGTIEVG